MEFCSTRFATAQREVTNSASTDQEPLTFNRELQTRCKPEGARSKGQRGGSMSVLVASDSQRGRSRNAAAITRPTLMKELAARGIRITPQRRLLVGIIQDSPRHLDAAKLLEIARNQDSRPRPGDRLSNDCVA